jgi:uncharacterized protein YbcI
MIAASSETLPRADLDVALQAMPVELRPRLNGGAERELETGELGELLAAVSRSVIHIHKRCWGKGPVKARAHLSRDLLVVILDGGFPRIEQTLRDHGRTREVLYLRLAMQRSAEGELRAAIEAIVRRCVRSSMAASDPARELQSLIFVLDPPRRDATLEIG